MGSQIPEQEVKSTSEETRLTWEGRKQSFLAGYLGGFLGEVALKV